MTSQPVGTDAEFAVGTGVSRRGHRAGATRLQASPARSSPDARPRTGRETPVVAAPPGGTVTVEACARQGARYVRGPLVG